MKMGNAGEAFFVEETDVHISIYLVHTYISQEPVPPFLAASPVGSRRPSTSTEAEKVSL